MEVKQDDEDDDEFLDDQEHCVGVMECIMGSNYWDKYVMSKNNYEFEFEPDDRDKLIEIGFGIWKTCVWCRNFANMMNGNRKKFDNENHAWSYDEFLDAFDVIEYDPIGHEGTKNDEKVDNDDEAFGDVNLTPMPQSTEQVDDFEEASTEMLSLIHI